MGRGQGIHTQGHTVLSFCPRARCGVSPLFPHLLIRRVEPSLFGPQSLPEASGLIPEMRFRCTETKMMRDRHTKPWSHTRRLRSAPWAGAWLFADYLRRALSPLQGPTSGAPPSRDVGGLRTNTLGRESRADESSVSVLGPPAWRPEASGMLKSRRVQHPGRVCFEIR